MYKQLLSLRKACKWLVIDFAVPKIVTHVFVRIFKLL